MSKAEYEGYEIETSSNGHVWCYVIRKQKSGVLMASEYQYQDEEEATMVALALITDHVSKQSDKA